MELSSLLMKCQTQSLKGAIRSVFGSVCRLDFPEQTLPEPPGHLTDCGLLKAEELRELCI